jgi:hypothetical protein
VETGVADAPDILDDYVEQFAAARHRGQRDAVPGFRLSGGRRPGLDQARTISQEVIVAGNGKAPVGRPGETLEEILADLSARSATPAAEALLKAGRYLPRDPRPADVVHTLAGAEIIDEAAYHAFSFRLWRQAGELERFEAPAAIMHSWRVGFPLPEGPDYGSLLRSCPVEELADTTFTITVADLAEALEWLEDKETS